MSPFIMSHLSSLLLKLLDGPLVDPTAFVDEMAGSGGLARVDMANDHNVDVKLLLSHDAVGQMYTDKAKSLGKELKEQ